jgi:hypothetical protein
LLLNLFLDSSSIGANALSFIYAIEPLIGQNYPAWREKIDMALAMYVLDYALTDDKPVAPNVPAFPADLTAEQRVAREIEF